MRTHNWLTRSADTVPDRLAIAADGERLTFLQLERRAVQAAGRLFALGAKPGERVGIVLEPSLEQVVLLHGLSKLGAVAVPLDPGLTDAELERRLDRAGTTVVVRDPAAVHAAPEPEAPLRTHVDLEEACCVLHTSGTAGEPTAIELTYGNHLWSALASAARIGVDPRDRWLCCLPLHHVGGLAIVLRSAIYATSVVLERFDAARVAAVIEAEDVTLASLVATTLARLLDAGAPLQQLRCALLGGGPVPAELIARALEAGAPVAPTYGLTEASSQVTTLPPGEVRRRPGSAGTPLLPTEVRIEDGRILVRGPTVAAGAADRDGWLLTGDLGRMEEGHLYVLGRADEVIVSGGENVSPQQVEEALLAHGDVTDAGVTAREDPDWQQAVTAIVVLRDGAAVGEAELLEFCRARLAPHEVPKRIQFTDRLPRDAQGKLGRRKLRDLLSPG
jgi:O-succinylbenzoic acid--CoA ligase